MSRFASVIETFRVTLGKSSALLVFTGILTSGFTAGEAIESQKATCQEVQVSQLIQSLTQEEVICLRDAVAYQITMGRSLETCYEQIKRSREGDSLAIRGPLEPLVGAMYGNLTAVPEVSRQRPRALALIGDRYHHPGYIRPALGSACRKVELPMAFIYDVGLPNCWVSTICSLFFATVCYGRPRRQRIRLARNESSG